MISLATSRTPRSIGLVRSNLRTQIAFFGSTDRIVPAMVNEYISVRLGFVLRSTVVTEMKTLRAFHGWLRMQGAVDEIEWPAIPARAVGTAVARRKRGAVDVTIEEVERFLAALPIMSTGKPGRHAPFVVRARFVFAWETGLRPATIEQLEIPTHWRPGARELAITDAIDKARFGRTIPLSDRAVEALASSASGQGLVFGRKDCRSYVRAASKAAAMPRGFTPYDLKHGRITALVEATGNLPGVAHLVGHRRVTTTAIYVRGSRRAAEDVLRQAGAFGGNSGASVPTPSEKSYETASNVRDRVTPWGRRDRDLPRDPRMVGQQDTAENSTSVDSMGALLPNSPGLAKGRPIDRMGRAVRALRAFARMAS